MTRCLALLVSIAGAAAAQQFIDPFNYPAGTLIPGYTEQRGDWQATGTEVQSQNGVAFQELTNDAIAEKDGCVELLAVYNAAIPGLQYAAPLMRHTGAGSTATYFMVKAQDNTTPYTGWDRFFVYWYNGASYNVIAAFGDIVPPTPLARIRLQVLDEGPTTRVQAFLDTDGDGLWNFTRDATTPLGLGVTGKIGINNYQSAKADDLKHFNAALYLAGTPTVGMPVNLNGRATSGYGYLGACSLGHAGIPLADGRIVPLDLDALMLLSLTTPAIFTNFSGTVDATGNFVMTLNTPPVPQLAGFTIWSSAVTFTPNGIQEIAPDVQITFVP